MSDIVALTLESVMNPVEEITTVEIDTDEVINTESFDLIDMNSELNVLKNNLVVYEAAYEITGEIQMEGFRETVGKIIEKILKGLSIIGNFFKTMFTRAIEFIRKIFRRNKGQGNNTPDEDEDKELYEKIKALKISKYKYDAIKEIYENGTNLVTKVKSEIPEQIKAIEKEVEDFINNKEASIDDITFTGGIRGNTPLGERDYLSNRNYKIVEDSEIRELIKISKDENVVDNAEFLKNALEKIIKDYVIFLNRKFNRLRNMDGKKFSENDANFKRYKDLEKRVDDIYLFIVKYSDLAKAAVFNLLAIVKAGYNMQDEMALDKVGGISSSEEAKVKLLKEVYRGTDTELTSKLIDIILKRYPNIFEEYNPEVKPNIDDMHGKCPLGAEKTFMESNRKNFSVERMHAFLKWYDSDEYDGF